MNHRNSHWRCSVKKGILRKFTKLTVKRLCQSLFFKKTLLKRDWYKYFLVNFAKVLRTPFLQKTSGRLLLELGTQRNISRSQELCNYQNCKKRPTRLECVFCHKTPEIKALNLKSKARLSLNIADLEVTEKVICRCRLSVIRDRDTYTGIFLWIMRKSFFDRIPLMAASDKSFYCKENNFSVKIFSQSFKDYSFTDFWQFLSYFKHVRVISQIHSNIKMEPFRK